MAKEEKKKKKEKEDTLFEIWNVGENSYPTRSLLRLDGQLIE